MLWFLVLQPDQFDLELRVDRQPTRRFVYPALDHPVVVFPLDHQVLFDTGSSDTWVPEVGCENCGGHSAFDDRVSSTAVSMGRNFSNRSVLKLPSWGPLDLGRRRMCLDQAYSVRISLSDAALIQ